MKTMQRHKLFRPFGAPLVTVAVGIVLTFGMQMTASAADTVPSAPPPHDAHKMEHDWARHRQEWMKKRLEKAAERLGIQSSQQEARQAYANAVESPLGNGNAGKADRPTDAAGIARLRADFAAAHAARMMNIANATARLQDMLTPEQQKKFNRMVAHAYRPASRHASDERDGHEGYRPPPHDDMPSHDQARP